MTVPPEFWTEAREREFFDVRHRLELSAGELPAEADRIIARDFEDDPHEQIDVRVLRIKAQLSRAG